MSADRRHSPGLASARGQRPGAQPTPGFVRGPASHAGRRARRSSGVPPSPSPRRRIRRSAHVELRPSATSPTFSAPLLHPLEGVWSDGSVASIAAVGIRTGEALDSASATQTSPLFLKRTPQVECPGMAVFADGGRGHSLPALHAPQTAGERLPHPLLAPRCCAPIDATRPTRRWSWGWP